MDIVVIGAGVVGVTTAWALKRRGHSVTVIEKHPQAGLEVSRANAGQRSYGHVSPWASPKLIHKALPSLFRRAGPLKIKWPPSGQTLGFLFGMWRYAHQPGLFERNHKAMLRLAGYSREAFLELERRESLQFDGAHGGLLKLASTVSEKKELLQLSRTLENLSMESYWLEPEAVFDHEPGFNTSSPLLGALRIPGDGTGDCHRFTQALAERCREEGIVFRFDTEVTRLKTDEQRLYSIQVRNEGRGSWLDADAFVVCAGCGSRDIVRSLGLNLPICPVKGYSLTAPLIDPGRSLTSTLVDDRYRIAVTRLGDRLRATGFVELAGFDSRLPRARLASIQEGVESRFAGMADFSQARPWSGFRPMTPDGPATLGRCHQHNVIINSGHGTWGWTLSAGSAEIVGQLVDGEEPAVELAAFDPMRFALKLRR